MKMLSRFLFLISLILLITSCSSSHVGINNLDTGDEVTIEATSFSFSAPDFEHLAEYKLSPGDVLDVLFQIQTWQPELVYRITLGDTISIKFPDISELDQTQKVLPDGSVSLPYLGTFKVYGKTSGEVAKELEQAYSEILKNPSLYVSVPEYLSQIREMKEDLHTSSRGLSRLVTIRPDGYVTFPMVGDVFVAARTVPEINKEINEQYAKISSSLHVNLFLEKHSGAKIYVLGEVMDPGAYDITKPTSVIQALALSKGHTRDALLDEVYVIRRKAKQIIATRVNVLDTLSFSDNGTMFYLLPDDIVYVPASPLSDAAHLATQIAEVLMFRGWGVNFSYRLNDDVTDLEQDIE
jgi:polysaccharide biosynthesis/export protein